EALVFEEAVAEIVRIAADVHYRDAACASVGHVVEYRSVAFAQVKRLRDHDVHRILHHAARVPWRKLDVGDDCIERIVGVDLTRRPADDGFVWPHCAKRHAAKGGRLAGDLELCNPGLCRVAGTDESSCDDAVQGCAGALMPRSPRRHVAERPEFLTHFDSS